MKTFKVTYEVYVNEEGLLEELEKRFSEFMRLLQLDPSTWDDCEEDFWTFVQDYLRWRVTANTSLELDIWDEAWGYLGKISDDFYKAKRKKNKK